MVIYFFQCRSLLPSLQEYAGRQILNEGLCEVNEVTGKTYDVGMAKGTELTNRDMIRAERMNLSSFLCFYCGGEFDWQTDVVSVRMGRFCSVVDCPTIARSNLGSSSLKIEDPFEKRNVAVSIKNPQDFFDKFNSAWKLHVTTVN